MWGSFWFGFSGAIQECSKQVQEAEGIKDSHDRRPILSNQEPPEYLFNYHHLFGYPHEIHELYSNLFSNIISTKTHNVYLKIFQRPLCRS